MTSIAPGDRTALPGPKLTGPRLAGPRLTAACVIGAVVLGLAALVALHALGRPVGLDRDLQSLDARLQPLEASATHVQDAFAYPKGAVCTGSAEAVARSLQASIAAVASHSKLAAASSTVSVAPIDGKLQPIEISLDGNGDYSAAIGALRSLAALRPTLLVDRLDLLAKGTYVHLHMGGRAYCWSPAHL